MGKRYRTLGPWLRVALSEEVALGPGKAALLEGIRDTGSIAGAGRRMGMSYKRAWQLVEGLNRDFRSPLVEAAKGGAHGGGARLTALGEEVVGRLRRLEEAARQATAEEVEALRALLPPERPDV